jgi:hypothetical protein
MECDDSIDSLAGTSRRIPFHAFSLTLAGALAAALSDWKPLVPVSEPSDETGRSIRKISSDASKASKEQEGAKLPAFHFSVFRVVNA